MLNIQGKARDLGEGFAVARILPHVSRRTIGPFVFFDYFAPAEFPPGHGIDVRPHPHIGLATVTYLFEGGLSHRDSLGYVQDIAPGEVNWMTAGRGIVHSERTGAGLRAPGHRIHGTQSWVGLPLKDEETAPSFQHVARGALPSKQLGGASLHIIAGAAYGLASPVQTFSPIFYVDAILEPGATLDVTGEYSERAVFIADGIAEIGGERHARGDMIVLDRDERAQVKAGSAPVRALLLGGEPLDGERHMWWNFVSSSKDRIEQAKADWKADKFGRVVGETEFIPLPE